MADDSDGRTVSLDVLIERQNRQGNEIKSLSESTARQFREFGESTARQFNELRHSNEAQVSRLGSDLNSTLTEIKKSIASNEVKIDSQKDSVAQSGRVNWFALIGAAVGVCGLAVTIAGHETGTILAPYNDRIGVLQNDLSDIKSKYQPSKVIEDKNKEQDERIARDEKTIDDIQKAAPSKESITLAFQRQNEYADNLKQRIFVNETKQDKLWEDARKEIVSRVEHEQHWQNEREREAELQRQLDEIKRAQADLYPAAALLRSLSEHQHELELKVYGGK